MDYKALILDFLGLPDDASDSEIESTARALVDSSISTKGVPEHGDGIKALAIVQCQLGLTDEDLEKYGTSIMVDDLLALSRARAGGADEGEMVRRSLGISAQDWYWRFADAAADRTGGRGFG